MDKIKVYVVKIQHDYETSERAGAGEMFQVISCTGILDNDVEVSLDVDPGVHFYDNNHVLEYLKTFCTGYDFSKVDIENDD